MEVDEADGAGKPVAGVPVAVVPTAAAVSVPGTASTNGSGAEATLSKQERKRLKKQRQKEDKRKRDESDGQATATASSQAASAAGTGGEIDDIFGAARHSGEQDGVGAIPAFSEGDGDGYVSDGEGGIVARDMDDLEKIFAARRAKAGKARVAAAAGAHEAVQERDAYVTGKGGKNRRLVDGLAVYTEAEMKKTALSDVKGTLDGPCPFDCSCCF